MSLFRPGPVPTGVAIGRPLWADLEIPEPIEPEPDPLLDQTETLRPVRLQAAQILQEAAAEAERAQRTAHEQGYEEGHREGVAAGEAELEQVRQQALAELQQAQTEADLTRRRAEVEVQAVKGEAAAAAQAVLARAKVEAEAIRREADEERLRRLDEAQQALVELAVAAASRLVQGHLAIQTSSVVAMVAAGIRRLKDSNCLVKVSPQDLPLLEAQRLTLERELGAGLLRLQPDAALAPGSYIASSAQGQVDARQETQVTHLRSALQAALGGA
jgi:flagellar assembly protein FliH